MNTFIVAVLLHSVLQYMTREYVFEMGLWERKWTFKIQIFYFQEYFSSVLIKPFTIHLFKPAEQGVFGMRALWR